MSDERVCPACGRASEATAPTCRNCGARFSGVILTPEPRAETTYGAEFPTVRDGSWRGVSTQNAGSLPLPPQVKAEAQRREAEWERRAAQQRAAARLQETMALKDAERLETCPSCGAPAESERGVRFSFCNGCGADIKPRQVEPKGLWDTPPIARPLNSTATTSGVGVGVAQAQAMRSAVSTQEQTVRKPAPSLAALGSFLIPGVGQMMNGQVGKGALIMLLTFVVQVSFGLASWGVSLFILRALLAWDAYRIAERRRQGQTIRAWEFDVQ